MLISIKDERIKIHEFQSLTQKAKSKDKGKPKERDSQKTIKIK